MICKWIAYHPITIDQRRLIKEAIDMDMSYSEMAEYVGRIKSVVMREAKRLGRPEDYDPDLAQADFEAKNKLIGIPKNPKKKKKK